MPTVFGAKPNTLPLQQESPRPHPNVVEFVETFADGDFTYVVLEYLQSDLATLLRTSGLRLTEDQARPGTLLAGWLVDGRWGYSLALPGDNGRDFGVGILAIMLAILT